MPKPFVYGYLNRVQSSRRVEWGAGRNLELLWLRGHLAPEFNTIADFRKGNAQAIKRVWRELAPVNACQRPDFYKLHSLAM